MVVDLSRIGPALRQKMDEIFRGDADLRVLKAIERQTKTAKAMRDREHRWKDDFGPGDVIVDPVIDSYWTAQYGHDWKENRDLVRWLKARNPEIVMISKTAKIQTGWQPAAARARKKKPRNGCSFGRGTLQLAT